MCGIAGYIKLQKKSSLSVKPLLKLMEHRGPDESSAVEQDNWGIGANRLAILAPREKNTQPLWSPDKRYCFVFNGEIYNHKQIREDLLKKNYQFKSSCDSEVLFYAYLEYKHSAFLKCQGMFACAVFDNLEKKWILARDPMGIKPLYFQKNKKHFAFASEIKPLLTMDSYSINKKALPSYLQRRFVMGRETLFSNIFRVQPAEVLEFSEPQDIKRVCYWIPPKKIISKNKKEREEEFSSQLMESLKITGDSDVELGALLSGGIDSAVVSVLSRSFQKQFNAYFFDNRYDNKEKLYAQNLSQKLNQNFHIVYSQENDFQLLPKIINHLEEPLGDSIIIPTYKLMREASKNQKAVLSGEGADEILGGYAHHFLFYLFYKLQKLLPLSFLKTATKITPGFILNQLVPYPGHFKKEKIYQSLDQLTQGGLNQFIKTTNLFHDEALKQLLPDLLAKAFFSESFYPQIASLRDLIHFDIQNWLPNYNLLRVDKLSMCSSLEVRIPYLNINFVNFCLSLPNQDLISLFIRKRILRSFALKNSKLGFKTAYRKKHPFTFKENKIYKNYKQFIFDHLDQSFIKTFHINPKKMSQLLDQYDQNLVSQKQVTSLLHLAVWTKEFF